MMRQIIFILLLQLFTFSAFSQEKKDACNRKLLEGFWLYSDAPQSFMLIQSDKAGEKLGEADMMIEYQIRWKEGCNHDLVVTKVFVGEKTPLAFLPHIYKVGDVIQVTVVEVNEKYFKYNTTYKGKTQKNMQLYRVPKELYEKTNVL